jgi:cytochrome c-type biogenesis protein CcmE
MIAFRSPRRRVTPAAVGAVVFGVALCWLLMRAMPAATVYYLTVGEFQALSAAGSSDRAVRVSGDVAPGTISRDSGTLRFVVADGTGSLPVAYQGVVPDIFGEGIQVVLEGRRGTGGVFEATTVLAKCPSKFEAAPAGGVAA